MDFSALNDVGQAIIGAVEAVISLSAVHAGVSIITVFIAVLVMQATMQGAGLSSRRARPVLAQRVTIGCLVAARMLAEPPKWPFLSKASAVSSPPRLLRLLPAGAKVAGWVCLPLRDRAFHGARRRWVTGSW